MQAIDQFILTTFTENRFEWLSFLMLVITYTGGYLVSSVVITLSTISFFVHRQTKKAAALLLTTGGSALTVFLLKNFFDKSRPSEALYLESSSAFPSGHATIAIALYGFLFYVIWKHDKHHLKNPFIILLGILILLIGLSRLYLGVHYLSDVLAGYMLGFIWIAISLAVLKPKI